MLENVVDWLEAHAHLQTKLTAKKLQMLLNLQTTIEDRWKLSPLIFRAMST